VSQTGSGSTGTPKPRYTVAKPGTELKLGDITVRVMNVTWHRHVPLKPGSVVIPGTRAYAVARLRVTNTGAKAGTVLPTQFWLIDPNRREYVTQRAVVPDPLIGVTIAPGKTAVGSVVYGTPRRFPSGAVLVYQFADAAAIASATNIGLAQFGSPAS
jgi:hypothetical protein